MKRKDVSRVLFAAALATGVLSVSSSLQAQYQIQSGQVLDANNRIGSYGYNNGVNGFGVSNNQVVTGNQVINGNVTGGREFRGFVPYTDPGAFRGPTAGRGMDDFVKNSSGIVAPYTGSQTFNNNGPRPFYGDSRAAPPPPGFVQNGLSSGYVPAPTRTPNLADTRLGNPDLANPLAPKLGTTMQPGLVDTSAQGIGGSLAVPNGLPSNGISSPGGFSGLGFDQNNSLSSGLSSGLTAAPVSPLQRQPLAVDGSAIPNKPLTADVQTNNPAATLDPLAQKKLAPQQLAAPQLQEPQVPGTALAVKPYDNSLKAKPLTAEMGAVGGEGLRQQYANAGGQAGPQSSQLMEMQKRLAQFNAAKARPLTDQQANQQFAAQKARQGASDAGRPADQVASMQNTKAPPDQGAPNLGGTEIGEKAKAIMKGVETPEHKAAMAEANNYAPSVPKIEPLDVSSLATGMQPGELSDRLTNAEKLMRQGKFQSAMDEYEAAARKWPANALVALGRANAELGASYYAQAERDLREAYTANPELLEGRYNLKQFLGADRLNLLITDLKEIATSDPKEPRPVFLLAYISYHSNNPTQAAQYLDLAERRAGKPDPVFKLLREHWALPAAAPAKTQAIQTPSR
jgi:tetratricopeptide (TPR) repeat protein